jgi:peptidoglycan-N-acetylglucosamine deacetylase
MTRWRASLMLALLVALVAGVRAVAEGAPLLVGFYLPWDAASRASATAHADRLGVLAPMSAALDSPKGTVRWQDDPAGAAALAKAHGRTRVFPVVSNAHDDIWDTAAAEAVLTDPAAGDAFIAALAAAAKAHGYSGYILDFETLSQRAAPAYAPFLARLRAALRPAGRELWVTALLSAPAEALQPLARATDSVILMAYDQCWANSTPGPIAGQDWLTGSLDAKLAGPAPAVPAAHALVALGAYGYDWPQGRPATVISAGDAQALAKARGQPVVRAQPDGDPHFAYTDAQGVAHQVWYLDAAAFRAQRAAAQALGVRGVAVWRLGLEDPALWAAAGPAAPVGPAPAAPTPRCVTLPPRP